MMSRAVVVLGDAAALVALTMEAETLHFMETNRGEKRRRCGRSCEHVFEGWVSWTVKPGLAAAVSQP